MGPRGPALMPFGAYLSIRAVLGGRTGTNRDGLPSFGTVPVAAAVQTILGSGGQQASQCGAPWGLFLDCSWAVPGLKYFENQLFLAGH